MSDSYLLLLEALRTSCHLPEFPKPLPSKQLDLELENGVQVVIDWNEKTNFVELFSELGTYSIKEELAILKRIAEANFLWQSTGGATLSVRAEIRAVYLASQTPVTSLKGKEFVHQVEQFIFTAQHWFSLLAKL